MEENAVDPTILGEKALKSFLCFLYVGKEQPCYKAKPWNEDDRYFNAERMQTLEILASNKKTELVPLDKIKLAMDSKLIQRPETLMFALAMCARQKKSEKLRAAAYYFLNEHCNEWKYFILFIKYASYLCRTTDKDEKHIGWGRGWKNAVNKFYLDRDSMDLAILVGRHKGAHGWKHKDILTLSHLDIQSLEADKRVVVRYVLDGLDEASRECHYDAEAKKTFDYLKRVDDFRRCQNSNVVANKIITAKYTIDHVHPEALKSKKVWQALLRDMDIRTVLKYLPKLSQLGLLTEVSPITDKIVQTLTDENNINWNKILPAEILSALKLYGEYPSMCPTIRDLYESMIITESNKTLRQMLQALVIQSEEKEKDKKKKKDKKTGQSAKKPIREKPTNKRIHNALRTALSLSQTVDITESSKKSYLVTIRLPSKRGKDVCVEAGLAIALPLFNRVDVSDDSVTIIGHEPREGFGSIAEITRGMSYNDAHELLVNLKKQRFSNKNFFEMPHGPIVWCLRNEKNYYDVVINVTNEPPDKNSIDIIGVWKEINDTRFINVIINRGTFELKGDIWHEVLSINGFDPHVPFIIEAYVRGLF